MGKRPDAAHIARVVRKYKDREYVSFLLRRSYREAGNVKHETLANLSALPAQAIEALRLSLAGRRLVDAEEAFQITRSAPHGHVAAVWAMARKLGLPALLGPAGPERDLAMALVVARVCEPDSKLATTRWWADTTLAVDLGVADASTDQVYAAMDWLGERQERIERRLARRHLEPGGLVYYDLSSSWMEGRCCPTPRAARSRWRSSPATPATRPPLAPPSHECATGSASSGSSWSGIVACSPAPASTRSASLAGWAGSPPCAPPRSPRSPRPGPSSRHCSTRPTSPRSPTPTTPGSGWLSAAIRYWAPNGPASAPSCWPPPPPSWTRSPPAYRPASFAVRGQSGSRSGGCWAGSRWPSTSPSTSPTPASAILATRGRSTPRRPWTASTWCAPAWRPATWTPPGWSTPTSA